MKHSCGAGTIAEFACRGPWNENKLVSNSDEQLPSVLATLEQCRTLLADGGNHETVRLLSMAILELRMKLNGIEDPELKALCDEMLREDAPAERSREQGVLRRRPLLRVVK